MSTDTPVKQPNKSTKCGKCLANLKSTQTKANHSDQTLPYYQRLD